jgi:protease IV
VSPWARGFSTFGGDLGEVLKRLAVTPNVKAVLVRFNTPGGTIAGSQNISDGLKSCREAGKYTIAYVPELSASGGVWAMVGAETIVAHQDAMLGSIGVLGPRLMHYEEVSQVGGGLLGEQVKARKISAQTLFAGKGKTLGDPYSTPDPDAVQKFQNILTRTYDRFVAHVGSLRGIPARALRDIGAAIFDAPEAQALKLVDVLGDLDTVKKLIAQKIGSKWDDCTVVNVRLSGRERFSTIFAEMAPDLVPWLRSSSMRTVLARYPALVLAEHWYP